jgi:hypothetical protein
MGYIRSYPGNLNDDPLDLAGKEVSDEYEPGFCG